MRAVGKRMPTRSDPTGSIAMVQPGTENTERSASPNLPFLQPFVASNATPAGTGPSGFPAVCAAPSRSTCRTVVLAPALRRFMHPGTNWPDSARRDVETPRRRRRLQRRSRPLSASAGPPRRRSATTSWSCADGRRTRGIRWGANGQGKRHPSLKSQSMGLVSTIPIATLTDSMCISRAFAAAISWTSHPIRASALVLWPPPIIPPHRELAPSPGLLLPRGRPGLAAIAGVRTAGSPGSPVPTTRKSTSAGNCSCRVGAGWSARFHQGGAPSVNGPSATQVFPHVRTASQFRAAGAA